MMPSRRDLAKEYLVSPLTLERAIAPLIADGTLRSDSRRGTFVAADNLVDSESAEPTGDSSGRCNAAARTHISARSAGIVVNGSLYERDISNLAAYGHRILLRSFERFMSDKGLTTQVVNSNREDGGEELSLSDAVKTLLTREVEAIAVVGFETDLDIVADALSAVPAELPKVAILSGALDRPIPHVFYDSRNSGYQAASHLIEQGQREITVFAPFTSRWVTERVEGVQSAAAHSALAQKNINLFNGSPVWEYHSDPVPLGRALACEALAGGWQPNGGIVCVNDGVAIGVMSALEVAGYAAGEDYLIIGFDDDPYARLHNLSSLSPPMEDLAREAVRLLAEQINGNRSSVGVQLNSNLIRRASTIFRS